MAKPHRFAWNGIDAETSLPIETIANMAQRAALESTGDLLKGKQRIVSVKSSDRSIEFRINDFLISFNKLLVFTLTFAERGGRVYASTSIDWYVTNQTTVAGFIPAGTKTMVAHHTYMQFVRNLAQQITAADPVARVTMREGTQAVAARSAAPAAPTAEDRPSVPTPSSPAGAIPPPPPPMTAAIVPGRQVPPPPPPPPVGRSPATPSSPLPAAAPVVDHAGPIPAPASGLVTRVPGMNAVPAPASDASTAADVNPFAAHMFEQDADLESTRIAQASDRARSWVLTLPEGRDVGIADAPIAIGRGPQSPASDPSATPVAVTDPNKSVSKTHALLAVRDGMLWVTDLHSTNGTTVTNNVGEATSCPPGVAMPVGDGWFVAFGEYTVRAHLGV